MGKNTRRNILPLPVTLFLAGAFLAVESGRMLLSFQWSHAGIGLPLLAGVFCMLCGFQCLAVRGSRPGNVSGIAGALLLTLHAGAFGHPAAWVCSFLFAGGISAFFIRTRKKNTFIPFAAAFVPALLWVTFFPHCAAVSSIVIAMLLSGVLIVNSVSLRHSRWFFLLLLPLQGLLFTGESNYKRRLLADLHDIETIPVAALPSSLLPDAQPGNVSVLQVTRSERFLSLSPWKHLPFVKKVEQLVTDDGVPPGEKLRKMEHHKQKFDLVSIEVLPEWHGNSMKILLDELRKFVSPSGGVIVVPKRMLLLSGERGSAVPGSGGRRFAIGKITEKHLDHINLDNRLQQHLAAADSGDFMPPGVFSALFQQDKMTVISGKKILPDKYSALFWIVTGSLWMILRMIFSRRGTHSAFLTQTDNIASSVLVISCAFVIVSSCRMYSNISELLLLWCIIPALPFCGRRGPLEKALTLGAMILPWMLTEMPAGNTAAVTALGTALIAAASAGITSAGMMLETGAVRRQLTAASFCGVLLGGVLFMMFHQPENIVPVLVISTVLRLSCLLRK